MFRLLRYFSIASAVAMLAFTGVLAVLYQDHEESQMLQVVRDQNMVMARSFANTVWPRFSDYVASVDGLDGDALRARPESAEIHQALRSITRGLPVVKVKMYHPNGLTVYSSDPSQMGDMKADNPRFQAAARMGNPTGKLSYKDTFKTFDGVIENVYLVESYLPIRQVDGPVEGVFELHTDVTSLMAEVDAQTTRVVLLLMLLFAALYGILHVIVRRADDILVRQYADLHREVAEREVAEKELRVAYDNMGNLVETRTAELTREIAERECTQKQLEVAKDRAEAANYAKSEFLANMSHELRTPLNAIIGFAEMMELNAFGPLGNAQYQEYAKHIKESGVHLADLVNDILDLSKVEAGKMELYETEVNVPEIVETVVKVLQERAERGGLTIRTKIESGLPKIVADTRMVRQMLLNTVSNAVKFTPEGGKIVIDVGVVGDGMAIAVEDTGIGIPADKIATALEPFGQVENLETRAHPGTGLGLPLTSKLMELHGGTLELVSEVGVGTTVTLRFPPQRICVFPSAG